MAGISEVIPHKWPRSKTQTLTSVTEVINRKKQLKKQITGMNSQEMTIQLENDDTTRLEQCGCGIGTLW